MIKQGIQLTRRQQAEEKLKEFLERELGDYSFHWSVETANQNDDEWIYFDIRYGLYEDSNNYLNMRVNPDKEFECINVNMYEDDWKVVEFFNSSIKYFWMVVKWE